MNPPHHSNEEIIFWVTIFTAWATILSLVYAALSFRLKSGIRIRGNFGLVVSSSVSCKDGYVESITLENLKDKAVVIYEIYLKLASNCFLILETLQANPLILKPFEVYTKKYDPVDFYSMSMKTLDLRKMFKAERRYKIRIVLSTGEGLYHVKQSIRIRSAYGLFFKNYLTAIVQPIRTSYKGRAYGGNAKYLLELVSSNGEEAFVPIYPEDHKVQRFIDFSLTYESLASRDSLEEYLQTKINEGFLRCASINVIDMQARRDKLHINYDQNPRTVRPMSKMTHTFIGLVYTFMSNTKSSLRNRRALAKIKNKPLICVSFRSAIHHLWRLR